MLDEQLPVFVLRVHPVASLVGPYSNISHRFEVSQADADLVQEVEKYILDNDDDSIDQIGALIIHEVHRINFEFLKAVIVRVG